jgi:hypothetical protein
MFTPIKPSSTANNTNSSNKRRSRCCRVIDRFVSNCRMKLNRYAAVARLESRA